MPAFVLRKPTEREAMEAFAERVIKPTAVLHDVAAIAVASPRQVSVVCKHLDKGEC